MQQVGIKAPSPWYPLIFLSLVSHSLRPSINFIQTHSLLSPPQTPGMQNEVLGTSTLSVLDWAGSLDGIITEPWFQNQSQAPGLLSLLPA